MRCEAKALWLLGAGGFLLLTACSSSPCERATAVNARLSTRQAACVAAGSGSEVQVWPDRAACDELMASCNEADERRFDAQLDCVDTLPDCAPDQVSVWRQAFLACQAAPEELSATCRANYEPDPP
jgi:hypothetical protein